MRTLLATLALSSLLVGCGTATHDTRPSEQAKLSEPAISETAPLLIHEYEQNELTANKKYKGRWLRVAGYVLSIRTTDGGGAAVFLGGDYSTIQVVCYFDGNNLVGIDQLKPGQLARVFGVCGGRAGTNVTVRDCMLLEF